MRGGQGVRLQQQQSPLLCGAAAAGQLAGSGEAARRAARRCGGLGAAQGGEPPGGVAPPVRRQSGVRAAVRGVRARAGGLQFHGALPDWGGPVVARAAGGRAGAAQQADPLAAHGSGGVQEEHAADRGQEIRQRPVMDWSRDPRHWARVCICQMTCSCFSRRPMHCCSSADVARWTTDGLRHIKSFLDCAACGDVNVIIALNVTAPLGGATCHDESLLFALHDTVPVMFRYSMLGLSLRFLLLCWYAACNLTARQSWRMMSVSVPGVAVRCVRYRIPAACTRCSR